MATDFGPNVFEFLAAIPVVERAEGHGRRPTPRFINIVMPNYGDDLRHGRNETMNRALFSIRAHGGPDQNY